MIVGDGHISPEDFVHWPAPNLAQRVSPRTCMTTHDYFLAIGLRVLILWWVEFCHFTISRLSPLTQCWRHRAACD